MKKNRQIWLVWLLALMIAVATGCGSNQVANNLVSSNEQQQQNSVVDTQDQLKTVYPLTITDGKGAEFTFESAPKRIVSLAPSETEGLFALGLDEEIVGVSDNDDYPDAAKAKPKMGGWEINVEAVVAAKPDLVVTADLLNEATVKSLSDLGLKVYQAKLNTLEDVINNIKAVGVITDHQTEAEAVVKQMEQERDHVVDTVKSLTPEQRSKVYIEFSPGWTVGTGTFMDEMITLAGGVNVASDTQGWNEMNEENIIKHNPDVILFANSAVDENNKSLGEVIKGRSGWNEITAIKENRVVGLDDNLLSRPGPRVTGGLLQVAQAIYPELFKP